VRCSASPPQTAPAANLPAVNLADRSVLLTGATGGLGQAIARRLHAAGAHLVVTGRRGDVLEQLAADIGARSLAVDLSDADAVLRLAEECADVDVLVANAGLPASGDLMSFSVAEIDAALAVNLRAPIVLARLIGERMARRGRGHLVFVSSLSGKVSTPGQSVYSATKFGLRGFALGLREDLRPHGVGVSTILPGFVRHAGMFHDANVKLPAFVGTSTPEAVADALVSAIERDRAEVEVAPVALRAGVRFATLAPDVAARFNRRMGAQRIADAMAAGQADKRR
jgi:short-subunit dehydrogenase